MEKTSHSSNLPVPQTSQHYAQVKLPVYLARRNAAWAQVSTWAPPSLENDWASFAVANGKYHKFYRFTHDGEEPEPDQVELASTAYFNKFIAQPTKREAPPKTDEQRDKTNSHRQVPPDFIKQNKGQDQ